MRPGAFAIEARAVMPHRYEQGLPLLMAALFFLAFPNPLVPQGMGWLGWVVPFPLMLMAGRFRLRRLLPYAAAGGFLAFLGVAHWAGSFHALGLLIVPGIMAVEFTLLALVLRGLAVFYPRQGWWLQAAAWAAFEWLRVQGFLGFPYGNIAATQYDILPVARTASLGGIWLTAWLLAAPAALAASGLNLSRSDEAGGATPGIAGRIRVFLVRVGRRRLGWLVWAVLCGAAMAGGAAVTARNAADTETFLRLALVQQDVDPKVGGRAAYRESLDRLIRQSDAALAARPGIDLVVWSETSFVPSVDWHERFREDPETYALVRRLVDWAAASPVPLLFGNGVGEAWTAPDGSRRRRDYNAVLLYEEGRQTAAYRKARLVPFSEYFPWSAEWPAAAEFLERSGSNFWAPGSGAEPIAFRDRLIATPICFEDSFGSIGRDFVAAGARLFVNLSNDSWSRSVPAAMQHLAMAAFRPIETGVAMARSTNGGMSALILADGSLVALNQPFTESWMVVDAPVARSPWTPYLLIGDACGAMAAALCALALVGGGVSALYRARRASSAEGLGRN